MVAYAILSSVFLVEKIPPVQPWIIEITLRRFLFNKENQCHTGTISPAAQSALFSGISVENTGHN